MNILTRVKQWWGHFHFRSAVTGKFITKKQADENPKESVKEFHKNHKKKNDE